MQAVALPALSAMGVAAGGGSAASILGTLGMGMFDSLMQSQQAQNQSQLAEEEARQIASMSLEESRLEADRVLAETQKQADELRQERSRERARRTATLGASGVLLQGSPLQVLEGQAYLDEQDAQELTQKGITNSEAIKMRGGWKAADYNRKADQARKNTHSKPLTSTLSTIGNGLSDYTMF